MREIKFRAWDSFHSYMDYDFSDDFLITNDGKVLEKTEKSFAHQYWHEYEETSWYKLMQHTGLKDKNGKEIYEGDIVTNKTKSFSGNGFRGKNLLMLVEWDQSECFYSLSVYDEDYWGFKKLTKSSAVDIEVIGNIYENLELIPNKF